MKPTTLAIDLIRLDGDTQSRLKINQDTVDDYVNIMFESNAPWPFPPLDVFFDGDDYFLGDGFHRLLGGKEAKLASIPCSVHKGGARDARIFGMTANDQHGLRMSRADKKACVEWLLNQPGKMTQAAIALTAGVSARTVQKIVADARSPRVIPFLPPQGDAQVAPSPPSRGVSDPFDEVPDAPGSPGTPSSDDAGDRRSFRLEPLDLFAGHKKAAQEPAQEPAQAQNNRILAKSLIDRACRAVCDLNETKPNRAKRDEIVKLLQKCGGMLW